MTGAGEAGPGPPGQSAQAAPPTYSGWSGPRVRLADALATGGGRVAGRYQRGTTRDLLEDASAVAELPGGPTSPHRPGHGDHVAATLTVDASGPSLGDVQLLSPARQPLTLRLRQLGEQRPLLEARARILEGIRALFRDRGFLEVETPARVPNPGLEPHLRPFPAGASGDGQRWLITSPELHLKQLLAAGYEKVFELARCFRDDERGPLHLPEFTMLEWYRTHSTLDDLAADLAELLVAAARAAGFDPSRVVDGCDLAAPFDRLTYAQAFRDFTGGDYIPLDATERDRRFVQDIEPYLGTPRPLLLTEYPADAAALARLVPSSDDPTRLVAARAELYVAGIELANGFDELTDPADQRRRHEADRATRHAAGTAVPPLDEDFLAALEAGCPPAAGMALGVDRLVMLLLGRRDVADVRAFAR